ncbi:probable calcium-binding protein CML18 [Typha latifolia]|uniref:probable calcium-binding protein CML18 n=1 Tax=Typha latifolia TaxID=4733 RepID=UPI003C2BC64F
MAKHSSSSLGLESMDEVEKVFSRYDANGDGKISASELACVVGALGSVACPNELRSMMDEMDSDRDGFIDLEEFAAFHLRRDNGRAPTAAGAEAELREAFAMYDLDRNGVISAKELHQVFRRLGEKCSVKDCSRMIRSVDSDGDGSVNFEEFKKMMKRGSSAAGPSK